MTELLSYEVKSGNKSLNDEIIGRLQLLGHVCKRDKENTPYTYIDGNKSYFATITSRGVCHVYVVSPTTFNAWYASNKV